MKKIVLAIALMAASFSLMSFLLYPKSSNVDMNNSWKARTTEKLYNSDYEITLILYSNGSVAIQSEAGPEGGSYDIDYNDRITMEWEKGGTDKGFVTKVQTTSGMRIKTVVSNGITFTNTERFVVPRR